MNKRSVRELICAAHYIKQFFVAAEVNIIFIGKKNVSVPVIFFLVKNEHDSIKKSWVFPLSSIPIVLFFVSMCIFIKNCQNVTKTKLWDRL